MSLKHHWIPILRNALRESEAVPLELTKASLRLILVEIMMKTKVSIQRGKKEKKRGITRLMKENILVRHRSTRDKDYRRPFLHALFCLLAE